MAEAEALDLFLHATKVGLFEMDWHIVCPHCGYVNIAARVQALADANEVYITADVYNSPGVSEKLHVYKIGRPHSD
jgi:hypothetical protein